jgi:hypothetical protein
MAPIVVTYRPRREWVQAAIRRPLVLESTPALPDLPDPAQAPQEAGQ